MSDLFNYKNIRNNVHRNSFSLGFQHSFTGKIGQILPIACKFCLPGDLWKLSTSHFTRTRPVNSAAYCRIKENIDFFFVPLRLLYRNAPNSLTQMYDYSVQASSEQSVVDVPGTHPFIDTDMLFKVQTNFTKNDLAPKSVVEQLIKQTTALSRPMRDKVIEFLKLCQMLNFGVINIPNSDTEWEDFINGSHPVHKSNVSVNLYYLLAYQKVFQDYFRDGNWEMLTSFSYNMDYFHDDPYQVPDYLQNFWLGRTPFYLNYRNYEKDMLFGMLPQSQLGQEAKLQFEVSGILEAIPERIYDVPGQEPVTPGRSNELSGSFSILQLRQQQFLQKWSEIAISGSQDYKSQIFKHWGVSLPDELSFKCRHICGDTNFIDINEVVNTALTGENDADIKGKGIGSNDSSYETFECKDYGILLAVYSSVPLMQYGTSGIDSQLLRIDSTDFPIPEFDSLGLQPMNLWSFKQTSGKPSTIGYSSRYIDCKTSVDKVSGDFLLSSKSWNATLTDEDISDTWNYLDFKVKPSVLDDVFSVKSGDFQNTDQLLVNCFVNMDVVRNLDYNGMPY